MKYEKLTKFSLKKHSELTERWVQDIIAADPGILGLGELVLKDKERIQPSAGRLDLLLQDDSGHRYEVEIQLGKTDESHIIRTLEYWDLERKRYPQYEHTAVIIAEEITGRFLNVIGLFNGNIPLIAIQMSAVQLGEAVSLMFTTVLDEVRFGLVDDDEDIQEITDRAYWESLGSKSTVALADKMLSLIHQFKSDMELKYNKIYIGLASDGQTNNFAIFKPRKKSITVELRLKRSDEIDATLESADLDLLEYNNRSTRYRLRLQPGDIEKHSEVLRPLFESAYVEFGGR
jgi:hypothetical protein